MIRKRIQYSIQQLNLPHLSWVICFGLVGLIIGIGLGYVFIFELNYWLIFGLILFCAWAITKIPAWYLKIGVALVIGILIGHSRSVMMTKTLKNFQDNQSKIVKIEGVAMADATISRAKSKTISLKQLRLNDQPVAGKVLLSLRTSDKIERGYQIKAIGKLEPMTGGYNGKINKVEAFEIKQIASFFTKIRNHFDMTIHRVLPTDEADLVSAILLGKRQQLDFFTNKKIRVVGLSHIIVASGLHLMIVVVCVRKIFANYSRKLDWWLSISLALLFGLIAGLSASMIRALLAMSLWLSARYYGHKIASWRLLLFLVAISLVINPLYLLGDLSWILSYTAFFAVVVVTPNLKQFFFGDKKLKPVSDLIIMVLAIQITLAPILILVFGELSLIAILANLLIIPIVFWVMSLGLLLLVVAFSPILAEIVSWPLHFLMSYLIKVITLLAEVPMASLKCTISPELLGLSMVVWLSFILFMSYQNYQDKLQNIQYKV